MAPLEWMPKVAHSQGWPLAGAQLGSYPACGLTSMAGLKIIWQREHSMRSGWQLCGLFSPRLRSHTLTHLLWMIGCKRVTSLATFKRRRARFCLSLGGGLENEVILKTTTVHLLAKNYLHCPTCRIHLPALRPSPKSFRVLAYVLGLGLKSRISSSKPSLGMDDAPQGWPEYVWTEQICYLLPTHICGVMDRCSRATIDISKKKERDSARQSVVHGTSEIQPVTCRQFPDLSSSLSLGAVLRGSCLWPLGSWFHLLSPWVTSICFLPLKGWGSTGFFLFCSAVSFKLILKKKCHGFTLSIYNPLH